MNNQNNTLKATAVIVVIILIILAILQFKTPAQFINQGATTTPGVSGTQVAPEQSGSSLPQVYSNSAQGFSIRLPAGYTVDESYVYQALGPGKDIHGVKFTIPPSTAKGTNLSDDSYISVEEIPQPAGQASTCTAASFASPDAAIATAPVTTVTDNGTTYSFTKTSDAGAGNRYEETVYALPGTNPCVAVRYFVHYGVFGNYPSGTITEFDSKALISQFDQIRRTLVVNQ